MSDNVDSVFIVASIGESWRRNIHQVSTPASNVSRIVASSMRFCMVTIGAKASMVGSAATAYQPAAGMPLAEAITSTPRGLTNTADP